MRISAASNVHPLRSLHGMGCFLCRTFQIDGEAMSAGKNRVKRTGGTRGAGSAPTYGLQR